VTGTKCTDVQLVTRVLPAGTYWFRVAPEDPNTPCGSDYYIETELVQLDLCSINPVPPGTNYYEGGDPNSPPPCVDDPNQPDPNGGCNLDPPFFEPLPNFPTAFTLSGKLWAHDGWRDLDWYSFYLPAHRR